MRSYKDKARIQLNRMELDILLNSLEGLTVPESLLNIAANLYDRLQENYERLGGYNTDAFYRE